MSGFRKRSPTGLEARRAAPKETRQNPQRWRQAFGDLRPVAGTTQQRESDFAQKWGTADANLIDRSEGPQESPSLSQPPLHKSLTRIQDTVKRRLPFTTCSDPSSSMDGSQSQPQQGESGGSGASMARNPIWKSSFRKADDISSRNDPLMSSAPQPAVIGTDRELEELVARPALTADERYRILDSRDKIIRKRNPKVKVRVEFAKRLAGTCLDMCPEKERYMREVQRRLSTYETVPSQPDSVVDHRLAIKEYSRSSADQEEPLPHELRPIQALHLTFNYLLHNIINRIEDEDESLSDLYYFIWDRTRAIRKDVTQQQLGSTEAVLLMERCVRFHIYCSTRLCELDRHGFDPKLNDENLMKCLQSLEHMYQDLAPHGINCPNEPEFRAYQILMKLNETDVVREIQQRPDWILKSDPVVHALKIYVALNNMNCVTFFKLVEKSSFMVSSILHRYFYQIRTNTLRRLLKAYSLKNFISMPTRQVKGILGFGLGDENMLSFKYFCESHGFSSRNIGASSMTMGSRAEFEQPEFSLINREPSLIESKLTVSISEAINGCPLGENPLLTFVPSSSFDENGYFKRELLDPLRVLPRSPAVPPPLDLRSGGGSSSRTQQTSSASTAPKPVSGDLRSRLGVRAGTSSNRPTPNLFGGTSKPQATPVLISPILPPSAATFSFSSGLAPPKAAFGTTTAPAHPATGFSFASAPGSTLVRPTPSGNNFTFTTSTSSAPAQPTFSFASSAGFGQPTSGSALLSTAPPTQPTFSFTVPSLPSNALALQKAKAEEEKLKIVAEVGVRAVGKILEEVIGKEVREAAALVRQEHVVKAAKEAIQRTLVAQIYKQVEYGVCEDVLRATAEEVLRKARAISTACVKIDEELRKSLVSQMITQIAQEVFAHETAEHNRRMTKLDGICKRIVLRNWFIGWKDAAAERKSIRMKELQRQIWNMENFPPILTHQLPTASILQDWAGMGHVLAEKPMQENSAFHLVERAMEVKRSFEKHMKEFRPSVIHHMAAPLLSVLNARPSLPPICPEFHPPVAINIVLLSEFDPWDHFANWIWESFSEDSVSLGDPTYCAHQLPLHGKEKTFLTFQKCSELGRASSDSWAVLGFLHQCSAAKLTNSFEQLRSFLSKNPTTPVVLFNSSRSSEAEIRHRLGLNTNPTQLKVLGVSKEGVMENIPTLVRGLHWVAGTMEVGPPVLPPVMLLPFTHLASALVREIFPRRAKALICPSQLFQEHNQLVAEMKGLVENPETLSVLRKWPGRASKLLIQKYSKSICFSHEEGKLGMIIKNMTLLIGLLEISLPAELIQKGHEGLKFKQDEIGSYFKSFIAKLMDGYQVSDHLRTRFNYIVSVQLKNPASIRWRDFLAVCQESVLEKLSTVTFASYQVCVDLRAVERLGNPQSPSRCLSCTALPRRKRGFSLDLDFTFLSPKSKSVCQESPARNLLKDIQSLLRDMKEEKEVSEASFTALEASYLC